MSARKFKFYHADRNRSLQEGMVLTVQKNGLSVAGISILENNDETTARERLWETVRQQHFPHETSRLASFFAANSIHEAEQFARTIVPVPEHDIPIWEVFAVNFASHDMNWRDYVQETIEIEIERAHCYWHRQLTNHAPNEGVRKPPTIEVKLSLPVEIGRLVSVVRFSNEEHRIRDGAESHPSESLIQDGDSNSNRHPQA